jgi:hypothetical protein
MCSATLLALFFWARSHRHRDRVSCKATDSAAGGWRYTSDSYSVWTIIDSNGSDIFHLLSQLYFVANDFTYIEFDMKELQATKYGYDTSRPYVIGPTVSGVLNYCMYQEYL